MKLISALIIKTDDSLKVTRHTLVITSYKTSSNSKQKIKEDEQVSSHPVIGREADDLDAETGSVEAPETSENAKDVQYGQVNGNS